MISPDTLEEFFTVNDCAPARAALKSAPHEVPVTVTVEDVALVVGSAAIVVPAASAGTATSAPATVQVRCPASRSQAPRRAVASCSAGAGAAAAGAADGLAARNSQSTTTR